MKKSKEILVIQHSKVIVRILPPVNLRQDAKTKLKNLCKHCKVGDVISPLTDLWEAEQ